MNSGAIFLQTESGLSALEETPYENEALLQQVLADFPDLIAGIGTGGASSRLLLVKREMPVSDSSGANVMSLDHLFVDADGVPVLVEVKRSSDTRSRREVVAQMLDYAANGSAYWPVEDIRHHVEGVNGEANRLQAFLGIEADAEAFWRSVEDNLRAGRIRLVFLADRLLPELVRIIEFLNEQMRDTEVLGVELPQFRGRKDGEVIYVPQLIGRTTAAMDTKGLLARSKWGRQTVLDAARDNPESAAITVLQHLFSSVDRHGGRFSWGTGAAAGVTGWYDVDGVDTPVWNVNLGAGSSRPTMYFIFRDFASRHAVERPERVEAFARAVSGIDGLSERVSAARENDWRAFLPITLADAVRRLPEIDAVVAAVTEPVRG